MAHYLKSMTDFVISQWDKDITREEFSQIMIRKATFLKRQPTKGDFVPCDLEGNVLEEPKMEYEIMDFWNAEEIKEKYNYLITEYQQAKERVLFKGVESAFCSNKYLYVEMKNGFEFSIYETQTFEDLTLMSLELTDNAVKMLGYEQRN